MSSALYSENREWKIYSAAKEQEADLVKAEMYHWKHLYDKQNEELKSLKSTIQRQDEDEVSLLTSTMASFQLNDGSLPTTQLGTELSPSLATFSSHFRAMKDFLLPASSESLQQETDQSLDRLQAELRSLQANAELREQVIREHKETVELLLKKNSDLEATLETSTTSWFGFSTTETEKLRKKNKQLEKCNVDLKKENSRVRDKIQFMKDDCESQQWQHKRAIQDLQSKMKSSEEMSRRFSEDKQKSTEKALDELTQANSLLESKLRLLLVETTVETHEHLTSTFPATASISEMVMVLEGDLSGLVLEFLAPWHLTSAGEKDMARLVSQDVVSLMQYCSEVFDARKVVLWAAVGKSSKARIMCQDLWMLIFPSQLMARCEVDAFVERQSPNSVWRLEWEKENFKELVINCIEQIIRLEACSLLSNVGVKILPISAEPVFFDKKKHKSIGSRVANGTECFTVFPRLECDTGFISEAFVLSSSEAL
jgi:hypothetical protein